MKNIAWIALFHFGLIACKNDAADNKPATIVHQYTATPENVVPNVEVVNDTLIRINFSQSDTSVIATANAYLNGDDHVVCEINIIRADSLHAELIPETDDGNIRFSQIIMPDGKADGPFGRQLNYATPQTGTYQLRIGENMMAGDKWKGKFKVKVWVK